MMTPETTCPAGKWGEAFPCGPIPNGLLDQQSTLPVWTAKSGWTDEANVPGETQEAPTDGAQYPVLLQGPPNAEVYEMSRENAGQMIPNRVAVNNGPGLSQRTIANQAQPAFQNAQHFMESFANQNQTDEEKDADVKENFMMRGAQCGRRGMHRMLVLVIVIYLFLMLGFRMRYPKQFKGMKMGAMMGLAILLAYYYWVTILPMPGLDVVGQLIWAILLVLFFLLVFYFEN
jgi:hypothetical protein